MSEVGKVLAAWRGNPMEYVGGEWLYSDTREAVSANPARRCGHCGLPNTPEGHDGCLGTLPGVVNACCGHGATADAYVQYENGRRIGGSAAVAAFVALTQHPEGGDL